MANKYSDMSLDLIRKELRKRGAKTTGRKADCVERLESYDRNKDFGRTPDIMDPVYRMNVPQLDSFKDLNTTAKIPPLSDAAVNLYLKPFGKSLGKDNLLWKSRFLRYVRWSAVQEDTFIRGNCRAEMRKSVTYDVDLLVDKNGNIRQTQCECAAGMGPNAHCKHIMCLLFCMVKFFSSGNLNTELTCTDKLQTFHQVKRYAGSPVKMGNITFGKRKTDTETKQNTDFQSVRFDPRKPKYFKQENYKKNYSSYVSNLAVNFVPSSSHIPIMQLVKPSNPFAYCLDHDYCKDMKHDSLLGYLKVSKISSLECQLLEKSTRGQASCKLWHEERLHRLSSSQFGRICKATDRTDMEALAKSYTFQTKLNTAPIRHGRSYESIAIKEYEQITGNVVNSCGIFVNPNSPFISSSPDGIVNNDLLVEVKCPYVARDRQISPTTVAYLSEDNGCLSLSHKHDYYYQVQGQLYCADRSYCDFIVYTKVDMKIIRITRDQEFIKNMLIKLRSFFESHFKAAVLNKYLYRNYYDYTFNL